MKTISVFFLFMLLVSCSHNAPQQELQPERLNTIHDILLHELTYMDDKNQYLDRIVYVHNHKDEIEKTFRVNEIDTCGNLFIAYFSCSIGAEIARDVAMFTKIDDTLCFTRDASIDLPIPDDSLVGEIYSRKLRVRYDIPESVDLYNISSKLRRWSDKDHPWWFTW